jgi:3-isopropylmalate/(R)-2-methylmalate dehydratase small subunit
LGLGEGLFAGWRYTLPGGREVNPDFILNQPDYANNSILLTGDNFGCGSSREHAVWALKEYGIRAIIAEGFGSIFYDNCIRNGLLPVVLDKQQISAINRVTEKNPQAALVNVNLVNKQIKLIDGQLFDFDITPARQEALLQGMDPIALTLTRHDEIAAFAAEYTRRYPWLS